MGERIIYSTLCALPGTTPGQLRQYADMASTWAATLRDAGRFGGRVLLLTNVPDLRVDGVEALPAPFAAAGRREAFVERVRVFRHVPVRSDDRVMHMDLDTVAVAPAERLFEAIRPGTLMAAPSGDPPLAHEHAGSLMTRAERWKYRLCGGYHRVGVSACVTACHGDAWTKLMRRWAAAIRGRGRGRPIPPLGDQSYLNFLFLTGAARVRRFPPDLIHHVRRPGLPLDDPAAGRAAVLHFPVPNKLEEMRRWSGARAE